jgi:tetratricopeptide (TPR) repeat protein
MSDIDAAITSYRETVDVLAGELVSKTVLTTLLARDHLSLELSRSGPATADQLLTITDADLLLKQQAQKINRVIGASTLADWRNARSQSTKNQKQANDWWWYLDSGSSSWLLRLASYILWGCIAVSLSFIVESARRFLSTEVGVLGTVLQGLMTLLVGGILVELAKQVFTAKPAGPSPSLMKRRLALTASLATITVAMWFLLPQIVKHYSDRGVIARQRGELSDPIGNYQRAISLEPSDSAAHYNLARSYEAIAWYDKAEEEYRLAIRWDGDQVVAYDGLARLLLARKKDYVEALRLIDRAATKLNEQQKANQFGNAENYRRIRVSLLKNRAWALSGLDYLDQAKDDLNEAIGIMPDAAAPYCLLAQVLEKMKSQGKGSKPPDQTVIQAYKYCIAYAENQAEKIEPDWLANAHERVDPKDDRESEQTKPNKGK